MERLKKNFAKGLALAAALAMSQAFWAGTITGKVTLEPREGVRLPSASSGPPDSYGAKKKLPPMVDYQDRSGVVVYLEEAPGSFKPPAQRPSVNQINTSFVPRILPVLAGTAVDFPNGDTIFHNVFSFSDAKDFDLGLYPKGESKTVTFDKPGIVRLYCSIHSEMSAVILVLQNPFFTLAKKNGEFAISGVPAGTYTLAAWHERFPLSRQSVTVPAEGTVEVKIAMGVKALPKVP